MEFIAATNNPGKMAEMRRILERMGHTVRSPVSYTHLTLPTIA